MARKKAISMLKNKEKPQRVKRYRKKPERRQQNERNAEGKHGQKGVPSALVMTALPWTKEITTRGVV